MPHNTNKSLKINPEEAKNNKLLLWFCVSVISLLTFFVFSPSLLDGFTNLDDGAYVQDNPLVVNNSISLAGVFKTPISDNYHPITILSLALNYESSKLNPMPYHLVNIILHVLNTILVFFFIFLLTRRNLLMAGIVALFFGIHPMHVESVTWISERKDVLYAFFFTGGLITYLRYRETKKIVLYIFTLLLFILSCLSKGMAVVFPIILLLIDYLKEDTWKKHLIIDKIPFFILSVLFGSIALKIQASDAIGIKSFTIFQRIMFASYGNMMYFVKLLFPYQLSAIYPYPNNPSSNGVPLIFHIAPFLSMGLLIALVYFFKTKKKEIVFGLLFFIVSVTLVLQFISVGTVIMAERYSYLSYIGLLFIMAYLINQVWQNKITALKYMTIAIITISAIVFSYQTYWRTKVWQSSETLWTDVIKKYPNSSFAYIGRGKYYHINNELEKAMADYTTALQLPPSDITSLKSVYLNRGLLYFGSYRNFDLAMRDYTKAIELDPNYADAYNSRGVVYLNTGKMNLAINDFTRTIALNPLYSRAYGNRAIAYNLKGKNDSAIADFSKAIELDPSIASYWRGRSNAENKAGMENNAREDAFKAMQLEGK